MIARQEEMDWLVYAAFGLLAADATEQAKRSPCRSTKVRHGTMLVVHEVNSPYRALFSGKI
jgi:hypothetical protein